MTSPLQGLRVLDFSRVLAGPLATMHLADLGADVIKVERPAVGDDTRAWGPPYDDHGQATYFAAVNRNKASLIADLNDSDDRVALLDLAARADVIVENFRPGVMDGAGLGYGDLQPANPGLVYCSITGFGADAGATIPGYDLLVQALGGLMSITGEADGPPQKVGVALVDVCAGLYATSGILAALRHRDRTGAGQRVEADLLSSLLAALVNQASAVTLAGKVAGRMGNEHPSIAPYEMLSARGGSLVVAVGNDRQFRSLCEALDAVELCDDPRFVTNADRVANRRALRAALERQLASDAPDAWVERLLARRVPAGRVNDIAGAIRLATELGLEPTVEVPRDDGSTVTLVRNPLRMSLTPPRYRNAPPALGPTARDFDSTRWGTR